MAVSIATINDIPDYSDEIMVKLCRYCIANQTMAGQTVSVEGQSYTVPPIDKAFALLEAFEARIAAASGTNVGLGIVAARTARAT